MSFEKTKFVCATGALLISLASIFLLGIASLFSALALDGLCSCKDRAEHAVRSEQLFLVLVGLVCTLPFALVWWFICKWNAYMRQSPATYQSVANPPRRRFQMRFENGVLKP